MSVIATTIEKSIVNSSWIRQMFEQGIALKQQHGEDAVCDFSLGNPDLGPPQVVADALRKFSEHATEPFALGYMPNGGYSFAREALAKHLTKEQNITLEANDVILTNGAAGGLNVLFKTILNPEDEVIALAPYFVEYKAYVENHGGVFCTVPTKAETFGIDVIAIAAKITKKTRAILVNSPNNPTGQVYAKEELQELIALLEEQSKRVGHPIYLVADEPYRFLVYDGATVPALLPMYPFAVVVNSFSKVLSIPGERIGYVALSPLMKERDKVMAGLTLCNRILGFVNPPVLGQHIMVAGLEAQVDISIYAARRKAMGQVLTDAGYDFSLPKGAFYFFVKAPGGDDVLFVNKLMKELILGVPGSGFGAPGYFRLAFCLDEKIIHRAAEGFKKALQR